MSLSSFCERIAAAEILAYFVNKAGEHARIASSAMSVGLEVITALRTELEASRVEQERLIKRLQHQTRAINASHDVFTAWATSLQSDTDSTSKVTGYSYKEKATVSPSMMNELISEATEAICKVMLAEERPPE